MSCIIIKASVEVTIVTLLPTLKINVAVEIKFWKTPSRIISQNLRSFQGNCLWQNSVLALSLRFTVILLTILKFIFLRNFTQPSSELSRTSKMKKLVKIKWTVTRGALCMKSCRPQACNFIKKRDSDTAKILGRPFLQNTSTRLLLNSWKQKALFLQKISILDIWLGSEYTSSLLWFYRL